MELFLHSIFSLDKEIWEVRVLIIWSVVLELFPILCSVPSAGNHVVPELDPYLASDLQSALSVPSCRNFFAGDTPS